MNVQFGTIPICFTKASTSMPIRRLKKTVDSASVFDMVFPGEEICLRLPPVCRQRDDASAVGWFVKLEEPE
jgi:hypothetical protein